MIGVSKVVLEITLGLVFFIICEQISFILFCFCAIFKSDSIFYLFTRSDYIETTNEN